MNLRIIRVYTPSDAYSPAGITFVKGFGGPGDTPSWTADDGVGSTGRTYTVGTQTPITFTDKVGMGTDATDGVTVTDMLRDIQSSVSTEGMMEKTTYILNGQVVGYSETEAMMARQIRVVILLLLVAPQVTLSFMMRIMNGLVHTISRVMVVII